MSDNADKESKTEEASQRRIEDAIRKGNTPVSREVAPFVSMLGIALATYLASLLLSGQTIGSLTMFFERPAEFRFDVGEDVAVLLLEVCLGIGKVALLPMLLLMFLGVAASMAQNPLRAALDRIKPQWSRLSIKKGADRIFGSHGRVEFLKAVFKFCVVAVVVYGFMSAQKHEFIDIILLNPRELPSVIAWQVVHLYLVVAGSLAALVVADLLWTRLKWHFDLRMTKQEVKDEQKQAEGDPIVRARQRSLARDRARRRMMAAVPRATVVIANPTHYAVALRYVRGEEATPFVLAKGLDNLALKIREIAEAHDIPVIEDRALARSLYEAVSLDRPIPTEFYRAVAEIILYLMSRSNGGASNTIVGTR